MKLSQSLTTTVLLLGLSGSSLAGRFCQPEDACWPTLEEISAFAASLNPSQPDCWGSFASREEPGEYVDNLWYPEAPDRLTIYELATLRNKVMDTNKAFFVVIAKDQSDVVKAVKFARVQRQERWSGAQQSADQDDLPEDHRAGAGGVKQVRPP